MKLLERAILGIIRKPTKSIIILLTSLIVMSILSSFFNVYHSIQSLTNEMNQMIQPTVMIERPTSSIKIDEDLNSDYGMLMYKVEGESDRYVEYDNTDSQHI